MWFIVALCSARLAVSWVSEAEAMLFVLHTFFGLKIFTRAAKRFEQAIVEV